MQQQIIAAVGKDAVRFVDATRLATSLCGDAIATNMFLLGYAWQLGLVPLSEAAILRAVEINGTGVQMNTSAFRWGRAAAHDMPAVEHGAGLANAAEAPPPRARTLDEAIALREAWLVDYQDRAYAQRYRNLVERVRRVEQERMPGHSELTDAVARSYYKLLAYKDEYEVARLHTDPRFRKRLEDLFEGDYDVKLHLAPPLLARPDPQTGEPRKREFGRWVFPLLRGLARLKHLRGTAFDIFGYTAERKLERRLIHGFEHDIDELLTQLTPDIHALAVQIAQLPQTMRGFGHVKQKNVEAAENRRAQLFAELIVLKSACRDTASQAASPESDSERTTAETA
jgi:indolepyruvate ferredoxin oxidoreductase